MFGHNDVVQRLKQSLDAGKLHHAMILAGPEGIGKETFCYQLIRYALANAQTPLSQDNFSIPDDHPVARKVAAQSHPHVFTIQPVFDDKKQRFKRDITLAALDGLAEFLRLKPSEDAPRFIIINPADGMNNNTQNALLKMLEEPPENTHFFLLTTQMGRLLPTIRSRCLAVPMEPLSFDAFSNALYRLAPDVSDQTVRALFGLSGGAVGQALQNEEIGAIENYGDICRVILAWHEDGDSQPAMKYAETIAREDVLAERMIEIISERLAVILKHGVTGKGTDAVIPEEERVLSIWKNLPQPKLLDLYDYTRSQWAACDAGYLDRKLVFLQILQKLSAQ